MFYSQLEKSGQQVETLHCGPSCCQLQLHWPTKKISNKNVPYSRLATVLYASHHENRHNDAHSSSSSASTSASVSSSSSSSAAHSNSITRNIYQTLKNVLEYGWKFRISFRCEQIPCLLVFLCMSMIWFTYYTLSNDTNSLLLYLHSYDDNNSRHNNPMSLYDLHHLLAENYPNTYVLTGPPYSKNQLGHITWAYLHTMAANYAEQPSEPQKKAMLTFWQIFPKIYSCGECSYHITEKLKQLPPNNYLNSNQNYSQWLCLFHNLINTDLKKPLLDCTDSQIVINQWQSSEYCGCDLQTTVSNNAMPL